MAMLLTSLSLLSPSVVALTTYTQVGPDINGTAAKELFGKVVSMSDDGNAFVVGAPYAYDNKGAVRVFQKDSHVSGMVNYVQVGEDIVGKASGDRLGTSVSMSGDGTSFVAGATESNDFTGSVSVYKHNTTSGKYAQVGLDFVGNDTNDLFGWSVSMSGNGTIFVVGALKSIDRAGYVSVYKYSTTNGNYAQVGADFVGKDTNDLFGWSVSMSGYGTIFVVGAVGTDQATGYVRVYKYSTTNGNYAQVGADIVGKATDEYFSWSVSMSGDGTSFVVGTPLSYLYTGYVRVYKHNTTNGNYAQVGADIVGKASGDQLGTSVSMSGNGTSFVLGAPFSISGKGSVSVYKYNTTNGNYAQVGADVVGKATDDEFGYSVSMSGDGTSFVLGAPFSNDFTGYVSVYKYSAQKAPTSASSAAPTKAPSKAPVMVISPTKTPITSNCGFLGLNFFCPRSGKCGFVKRLLNLGNCS